MLSVVLVCSFPVILIASAKHDQLTLFHREQNSIGVRRLRLLLSSMVFKFLISCLENEYESPFGVGFPSVRCDNH